MTQASFPFEGIDTTETQFSKWARHFNSGVDDVPTGTALEVSAGTGLAVDVEAGEAMVRGHYYTSDATEALALATADATNDRIDTVVLRLDPTANSIILAVKTGTPAGSPTAPALVQTDAAIFEQPLADVLVPATAGVPSTITIVASLWVHGLARGIRSDGLRLPVASCSVLTRLPARSSTTM